jgi:hypothetical protein
MCTAAWSNPYVHQKQSDRALISFVCKFLAKFFNFCCSPFVSDPSLTGVWNTSVVYGSTPPVLLNNGFSKSLD